jgi:hypothetical protein
MTDPTNRREGWTALAVLPGTCPSGSPEEALLSAPPDDQHVDQHTTHNKRTTSDTATCSHHILPTAAPPTSTVTSVRQIPRAAATTLARTRAATLKSATRITRHTSRDTPNATVSLGFPSVPTQTAANPSVAYNRGPSRATHRNPEHLYAFCMKGYEGERAMHERACVYDSIS